MTKPLKVDPPEPRIIYPPGWTEKHEHDLGGAATVPLNTLRQCGCGKWFRTTEKDAGWGYTEVWQPVYWWNFILRRRIARAL